MKPSLIGGFSVPDNLRYHPGHTWALILSLARNSIGTARGVPD
jgi:hypothetical protein